jgi:hypothetical protein
MNKKKQEKRDTPIIDGDARPDMPREEDIKKATKQKRGTSNGKNKFESERISDVNSLEDYKDAK